MVSITVIETLPTRKWTKNDQRLYLVLTGFCQKPVPSHDTYTGTACAIHEHIHRLHGYESKYLQDIFFNVL